MAEYFWRERKKVCADAEHTPAKCVLLSAMCHPSLVNSPGPNDLKKDTLESERERARVDLCIPKQHSPDHVKTSVLEHKLCAWHHELREPRLLLLLVSKRYVSKPFVLDTPQGLEHRSRSAGTPLCRSGGPPRLARRWRGRRRCRQSGHCES